MIARRACLAVLLSAATLGSGSALAALSSASGARVAFQATGTGMRFEGTTPDLDLAEHDGNVVATVTLARLTTGIDLRDHHMRDKYLEVQRYPTAVLTIARSALNVPPAGQAGSADVPASLLLHGQTRQVTVHYDATGDAGGAGVSSRVHLNMNDFGITVPSYLGVTVKPDVDVTATFHVAGS